MTIYSSYLRAGTIVTVKSPWSTVLSLECPFSMSALFRRLILSWLVTRRIEFARSDPPIVWTARFRRKLKAISDFFSKSLEYYWWKCLKMAAFIKNKKSQVNNPSFPRYAQTEEHQLFYSHQFQQKRVRRWRWLRENHLDQDRRQEESLVRLRIRLLLQLWKFSLILFSEKKVERGFKKKWLNSGKKFGNLTKIDQFF